MTPTTIEALKSFGQTEAISALAKDLKEAYDFALKILGEVDNTEEKPSIQKEKVIAYTENGLESKFNEYDSNWSLKNKFLYILKKENRFLHFREVAKIILNLEGNRPSYENQRELARLLSGNTALRNYRLSGHVVNVKHDNSPKKSFWGSKKWLNANNEIIPQYKYSLEIMNEKNKGSKPSKEKEKDLFNI